MSPLDRSWCSFLRTIAYCSFRKPCPVVRPSSSFFADHPDVGKAAAGYNVGTVKRCSGGWKKITQANGYLLRKRVDNARTTWFMERVVIHCRLSSQRSWCYLHLKWSSVYIANTPQNYHSARWHLFSVERTTLGCIVTPEFGRDYARFRAMNASIKAGYQGLHDLGRIIQATALPVYDHWSRRRNRETARQAVSMWHIYDSWLEELRRQAVIRSTICLVESNNFLCAALYLNTSHYFINPFPLCVMWRTLFAVNASIGFYINIRYQQEWQRDDKGCGEALDQPFASQTRSELPAQEMYRMCCITSVVMTGLHRTSVETNCILLL